MLPFQNVQTLPTNKKSENVRPLLNISYVIGTHWYLKLKFVTNIFWTKILKSSYCVISINLEDFFFFCFIFRAISFETLQQFAKGIILIKFSSQSSFHFYCLVFIPKDFMLMVIMLEEFLFDRVHT